MKKLLKIFAIAALALVTAASATAHGHNRTVKGSGNIITREVSLDDFRAVTAARSINVILVDGATTANTIIEADDNVMDLLDIRVENGVLYADFDRDLGNLAFHSCNVTVTAPVRGEIDRLKASSAATVTGRTVIKGDDIDIYASSAARIEVAVVARSVDVEASSAADIVLAATADEFDFSASSASEIMADITASEVDVDASSASDVTLRGKTTGLDADASSSSEIDASKLESAVCDADASSAAEISVWCTERLDASASSGADIDYRGDCATNITKSSGGSVKRKN